MYLNEALKKMFPFASEDSIPTYPQGLQQFLEDRLDFELDKRVHGFTAAITRILCEVTRPKTHVQDMVRIVVEKAKLADEFQLYAQEFIAYIDDPTHSIDQKRDRANLLEQKLRSIATEGRK